MEKTSRILTASLLMGFPLASCSSKRGFTPHKYETHGGVIIVDSQNDNIAYVTTGGYEYHPLKADTYKKLMIELVRVFRKRYS